MKRRSFLSSAAAVVAWPFSITRGTNAKDEWWRCVTETYGYLDTYYCLGNTPRWLWHPFRDVGHELSDDSKSVVNEGRRVVLDQEELTELRFLDRYVHQFPVTDRYLADLRKQKYYYDSSYPVRFRHPLGIRTDSCRDYMSKHRWSACLKTSNCYVQANEFIPYLQVHGPTFAPDCWQLVSNPNTCTTTGKLTGITWYEAWYTSVMAEHRKRLAAEEAREHLEAVAGRLTANRMGKTKLAAENVVRTLAPELMSR